MQTTAIQNPSLTQNLPTAITTILATPAASAAFIVSGLTFCNKTASPVTVNVSVYNGTTDTYLAYGQTIDANDTMAFGGDYFKAQITNGFSLRALCSVANAVDVTVHYAQFS